ncbi:ABC transporter ATP-binding protein [Tessaracoccus rhinocerotis]|uniref:ABC transporter ATP-binding protein n=1 Tax=Tessaracoccus rhinocerotis TaxID=1689449 RepID=A0A553K277_9ACTN|nr:ABC transporter ATP-binding protein [Tessaracoccus rhinocerotis]TRY18810.1 ABC transporter ATP-binding protein [Tessaracoccus rhinocerotis]
MLNSTLVESAVSARALVVHRAGNEVLHGLEMDLAPGSVTGLLGPSGCGKTTLMRAMVGVQRITSGSLTVLGRPAADEALRRRVAYTSQTLSVYRDLSIRDNVAHFARLVGAGPDDVARTLDAVELTALAGRRVEILSGGQASRASLACALVGSPELLVLDEPTVGLDPLTRESLWEHFHALARQGTTLLVSSHVMDEATRCDSILLMREGHFLAHAPIDELQERTGAATPEDTFLTLIKQEVAA